MTSGIYKLVNTRTSETYVGQSTNIEKRAEQHIQQLEENNHYNQGMQEDYNNDDEFLFEVIEETHENKQILNEQEMLWISRLNTFYEGYNQTPGGDYDKSKGNIGYGGGRLPEHKYKSYKQPLQINFKKEIKIEDEKYLFSECNKKDMGKIDVKIDLRKYLENKTTNIEIRQIITQKIDNGIIKDKERLKKEINNENKRALINYLEYRTTNPRIRQIILEKIFNETIKDKKGINRYIEIINY